MIAVKFAREYSVQVDRNPTAHSWVMCQQCGEVCHGHGRSLTESMAAANIELASHACEQQDKAAESATE